MKEVKQYTVTTTGDRQIVEAHSIEAAIHNYERDTKHFEDEITGVVLFDESSVKSLDASTTQCYIPLNVAFEIANKYYGSDYPLQLSQFNSTLKDSGCEPLEIPSPPLSQSEVEKIAGGYADSEYDKDGEESKWKQRKTDFIAGFTHPQKPSGKWYSRGQMKGFGEWLNKNNWYLAHPQLDRDVWKNKLNSDIKDTSILLDLFIASLNNENKDK